MTVQRLAVYLRCLDELPSDQASVSSDELAARAGVNSAKVRKDLSYLGSYGVRGVGYDTEHLRLQISLELGLTREWAVIIVGIGNLGRALANYAGLGERRFRVVGVFDNDPAKMGAKVDSLVIEPMEEIVTAVRDRGASIGIITTPASGAQEVAYLMADAGIRSILNFAPTVIHTPKGIELRRVDLSTELQVLAYYQHKG